MLVVKPYGRGIVHLNPVLFQEWEFTSDGSRITEIDQLRAIGNYILDQADARQKEYDTSA